MTKNVKYQKIDVRVGLFKAYLLSNCRVIFNESRKRLAQRLKRQERRLALKIYLNFGVSTMYFNIDARQGVNQYNVSSFRFAPIYVRGSIK